MFVDRELELAALEREYARRQASLVVVYGRRRVGKTALISTFIADKPALYYLATEESETQNRAMFQSLAAEFVNNDILREAALSRWEPIFRVIAQSADRSDRRTVIVVDEFQYLGMASPDFPSVFQRIWDTVLARSNVMVILCGSLVSMMESQTLAYDSPLYGRRTAQLKIGPIPFSQYHRFFPGMTMRELVERYSVTGGVPKYIESFEDCPDIYQAIRENVLDRSGFLYDEPMFLLRGEVSDVGTYYSVIKTIAAGNRRTGQIASTLGVPATAIPGKLATLRDLGIVEREVPVTERQPEKSKRGLYRVCDVYLDFWFRFVQPNLSYIESGHPETAMARIRRNFIDNHVAYVYEEVCRERLWDMSADGKLPFRPERVGHWWGAGDAEIDVAAISDEENALLLGECKFWRQPVGLNVLRALERKSDAVDWHRDGREEYYALFSISGFSDDLRAVAAKRSDVVLVDDAVGSVNGAGYAET